METLGRHLPLALASAKAVRDVLLVVGNNGYERDVKKCIILSLLVIGT